MGQKVNPIGFRVGINKNWESRWMAPKKDIAKYIEKDFQIRNYLEKTLKDASIAKIEIERTAKKCEVIVHTSKPGVMIGRGGEEINKLKQKLSKMMDENIQVSIMDIKNIDLNATLVAQSIAKQIETRAPFRSAQKRAIRNAMKAGAKGIKTLVSGRLNGAEMARNEGYTEGNVPLQTIRTDIDYGFAEANTTYGKLGVKVWINKGEILPSKPNKGGN
jgi:small subunit ribosomal protein S3